MNITRIRLYRSDGQWRWTAYARNGRVIAASTEGYTRRASAVKS